MAAEERVSGAAGRRPNEVTARPDPKAGAARPAAPARARHLVHVFPSFGLGGVPIRIATVINLLGEAYRHTIVAMDGCQDGSVRLDPGLQVSFSAPPVRSRNVLGTAWRVGARLRSIRPDLLLTYNWGATEWALANTLRPVCPHVHFESGFGVEEAERQIRRRVLFRRLALARATRIVVPSRNLVEIATRVWKLDPKKVLHIPNGVDWRRFAGPPEPDAIAGFDKRPGELVVGTVAPLRPEKNLARLLCAFAALGHGSGARLLVVGDGPVRPELEALAARLGIAPRVLFAGHLEAVEKVLGWFDVFAMSSDTEQMPNSLLQAMAAGLPVAATDVGDVKHIVAPENAPFVVPKSDERALTSALERLLADPVLRRELGQRNRERARAQYALDQMVEAYRGLFETACGAVPARPAQVRLQGLGRAATD